MRLFHVQIIALIAVLGIASIAPAQRGRRGGGGEVVTVDSAKAATIKGRVVIEGAPAKEKPIRMDADPTCMSAHDEVVFTKRMPVSENGGMEEVFVYVSGGLEGKKFATSEEAAVLDQVGCVYTPQVLGVQTGQPLTIKNSDPTLHNVKAESDGKVIFNLAMPTKDMEIKQEIRNEDVMVKVQCDVHPWMEAYIGALDHPFFAVTDENGNFEISGLPAGTYEITTWQRLAKTRKLADITVGDAETKEVEVKYAKKKKK